MRFQDLPTASGIPGCCPKGQGLSHGATYRCQAVSYTHLDVYKRQGFIGKDAEIRSFETASVARFSIAVSRADKTGEETSYVSAFMGIEAWRKNVRMLPWM